MNTLSFFRHIVLLNFLVLTASGILAQGDMTNSDFEPEIGQKGKDVVWVPTPHELVDTMLSIANVKSDDYVIDLGSGDGRTVISAAKKGAHALGIEYNPDMVALSRKNAEREGVSGRTEFIEADLYECDLSKATVITMFLLPEINLKLRPRLLNLKPGTRLVSNTFTMGDWEADYEVTTPENWNSWNTALLWIVPAKVDGSWKLGTQELLIRQDFQMVYGKLVNGSDSVTISNGRLRGNEITFCINGVVYLGNVDRNKMEGTYIKYGKELKWSASR